MIYRTCLGLACWFIGIGYVAGAEEKNTPEAARGPEAAEFYRLQGELADLLAKLAGLQAEYRTAGEVRRSEIQRLWKDSIDQGKTLEPKLIEAAEKACAAAPEADPKINEFLVKILAERVERDDYEPAARIGQLLLNVKELGPRTANLAGIAAFATNDFDAAEKFLKQAAEKGYYQSPSEKDKLAQVGAFYLQSIDAYQKSWAKEKAIRETESKANNLPRVLLATNKGDIIIELFENQAPNTVANFINLVQRGFYNGLTFHRVLAGFMAQGGDPAGNGTGGPGYSIACECYRPDARQHFRGTLSMAHAGRDTGGSQFFLTFVPTPHLDGRHTVFGRVVEGRDVRAKPQRRDPDDLDGPRPDTIVEARVLRKRDHPYVPKKMPQ